MPLPPSRITSLHLQETVATALQAVLPRMAARTVAAVTVEVPTYTDAFSGRMGQNIENAVQMALGTFLKLVTQGEGSDPAPQLTTALDGAYELGRGEARHGRSIEALLAAYRVGAQVAWRELSATAVDAGLDAATIARFAEMVFAFIDELSASSVTGHADQLATTGRVRERYLERLGHALLSGEPAEVLEPQAQQANWAIPNTLTAALMPSAQVRGIAEHFGPATLQLSTDLPGVAESESLTVLLVPDVGGARRATLVSALAGRQAWVGPARPWTHARVSYERAMRCRFLRAGDCPEVIDSDEHLVEFILGADLEAGQDLRRRALAPLAGLRPNTVERLAETLRSWLLHQGRRDSVAAELFVHPQTIRYRMTQLRQLYGDQLDDSTAVLELLVALSIPSGGP